MKKIKQIATLVFILLITNLMAQKESNAKTFGFYGNYKLGTGTLEHNQIGSLSGNLSALEGTVFFNAFDNTKLGLGLGFLQFQSNFYDGTLNNQFQNSYLQIPMNIQHRLSLHSNENESNNLFFVVGLGVYANSLLRSETNNLEEKTSVKNQGWNFGNTAEIGFEYWFNSQIHFGLYMQHMNDWEAIKKAGVEQKITDSNFLKFGVGVSF